MVSDEIEENAYWLMIHVLEEKQWKYLYVEGFAKFYS